MSDAALETMKDIASTYVDDGYPNYRIWWFRLRDDDDTASELTRLGLIEPIGIWRSYKLTLDGQDWVTTKRSYAGAPQYA